MQQLSEMETRQFGDDIRVYPIQKIKQPLSDSSQKTIQILSSVALGLFPIIIFLFFSILSANTFHTDKQLSLQFYTMAIEWPIIAIVPIFIVAIICICNKKIRLVGIISLSVLGSSVPILLFMMLCLIISNTAYF